MLTNWSFWAVVVSIIAIVLYQLPPVRYWFKSPRLDIELSSRIFLTHRPEMSNKSLLPDKFSAALQL